MKKTNRRSKRKKTSGEPSSGISNIIKGCGIGLLFSVGSALLLSFLSSLICLGRGDPASLTPYFSLISLGISAFIGGAVASKLCVGASILPSLITATAHMLLLFILSFILPSADSPSSISLPISIAIRALILLISAFGGYVGNLKPSAHRRSKRH